MSNNNNNNSYYKNTSASCQFCVASSWGIFNVSVKVLFSARLPQLSVCSTLLPLTSSLSIHLLPLLVLLGLHYGSMQSTLPQSVARASKRTQILANIFALFSLPGSSADTLERGSKGKGYIGIFKQMLQVHSGHCLCNTKRQNKRISYYF